MFLIENFEDTIKVRPYQLKTHNASLKKNDNLLQTNSKPGTQGFNMKDIIVDILRNKFEGKIFTKINGYVVKILNIDKKSILNGSINDINGEINYKIKYSAVIFKPIKNSVLDIVVDYCNDLAIWGHYELLSDVSIIECITPSHLIPENYTYNEMDNYWDSDGKSIKEGSFIKIKVINVQIDVTKMSIIGEII